MQTLLAIAARANPDAWCFAELRTRLQLLLGIVDTVGRGGNVVSREANILGRSTDHLKIPPDVLNEVGKADVLDISGCVTCKLVKHAV